MLELKKTQRNDKQETLKNEEKNTREKTLNNI